SYKLFQFFITKDLDPSWLSHLRDYLRTHYFAKAGKLFVEITKIVVFGLPLLLCYALAARPVQLLLALGRSLWPSNGRLPPRREPLLNYLFVRRPLLLGLGV